MTTLQDALMSAPAQGLTLAGALIGLVFGILLHRTNFCAMGGISDAVTFGDSRRFRSWVLAGATALAGATWLQAVGLVDLDTSLYRATRLNWFGHLAGGGLFGAGMVLAGGCASRNLVRAGTGDLRAGLTLVVLGITAFVTLSGVLGAARVSLADMTAIDLRAIGFANQGLDTITATVLGTSKASTHLVIGFGLALLLSIVGFSHEPFRTSPVHIVSGIGVGLCIIAAWLITGLSYDELSVAPTSAASLTFVRPVGDTLDWLQRSTALGWPGLGPATVGGTLVGAFVSALAARRLRVQTFADTSDTLRHMLGAMLMGFGGVLAVGCSIGQGVTGISTLALGAFLTFAAIVAGAVVMLRQLEKWL